MNKQSYIEKLEKSDPNARNRAIQEHKTKVIAMTEEEFSVHYAELLRKRAKFEGEAKRLAQTVLFRKGKKL